MAKTRPNSHGRHETSERFSSKGGGHNPWDEISELGNNEIFSSDGEISYRVGDAQELGQSHSNIYDTTIANGGTIDFKIHRDEKKEDFNFGEQYSDYVNFLLGRENRGIDLSSRQSSSNIVTQMEKSGFFESAEFTSCVAMLMREAGSRPDIYKPSRIELAERLEPYVKQIEDSSRELCDIVSSLKFGQEDKVAHELFKRFVEIFGIKKDWSFIAVNDSWLDTGDVGSESDRAHEIRIAVQQNPLDLLTCIAHETFHAYQSENLSQDTHTFNSSFYIEPSLDYEAYRDQIVEAEAFYIGEKSRNAVLERLSEADPNFLIKYYMDMDDRSTFDYIAAMQGGCKDGLLGLCGELKHESSAEALDKLILYLFDVAGIDMPKLRRESNVASGLSYLRKTDTIIYGDNWREIPMEFLIERLAYICWRKSQCSTIIDCDPRNAPSYSACFEETGSFTSDRDSALNQHTVENARRVSLAVADIYRLDQLEQNPELIQKLADLYQKYKSGKYYPQYDKEVPFISDLRYLNLADQLYRQQYAKKDGLFRRLGRFFRKDTK